MSIILTAIWSKIRRYDLVIIKYLLASNFLYFFFNPFQIRQSLKNA